MIEEIQSLSDEYWKWLQDWTTICQVNDWTEITTPYLNRHNDILQNYTKRRNGGFLLSNDGYIIRNLKQSGCKIDTDKRKALLNTILNGCGVQTEGESLQVQASLEIFPLMKHNLVQAMPAVDDIFHLTSSTVVSDLLVKVATWLDSTNVQYTPDIKLTR